MDLREDVEKYIKKKYKASPEYLWKRYPDYAVFRHEDNRKWFAIIMDVDADKLGLPGTERIDIIDVKIDDLMLRDILLQQEGFLPAYHMNKGSWITILLDGTVKVDEICNMIDASFLDTASRKKKDKFCQAKEWLVPANPKYYDIEHAFDETDEIDWKQGARIIKGDTVFMYVGAPVSAIFYKCKVTEVDIPYEYEDKNLSDRAKLYKEEGTQYYHGNLYVPDDLESIEL
ncbi:Predicted DNA-binding protein, MmcQ/YjbR family [Acetitomaculum ruminis DSM 5522]|uniref:Predicted DNA-binding protein, MmcQ/YjbR family n=1 Tax=Acetitomaculum ruminis DSM 5522 TaxID=1120918 RepID=A0A1I0ZZK4_9FIRM|nr:MmcQ/YjbR family DNA-binding protein [Acetitomaculum ruminis]SFB31159.1 Predicted DNA-binding protein, MmcQ/YjbR family [Acetitomaculum ruminis DSM 5522]